jgi:hypothetical protein
MGDRTLSMLCGNIGMAGFAMFNGFLEMFDPFIYVWILPGGSRMLECFLSMFDQYIGMPLFTMCHSFLGMLQSFSRMLVSREGEPAEQREANKRDCRHD